MSLPDRPMTDEALAAMDGTLTEAEHAEFLAYLARDTTVPSLRAQFDAAARRLLSLSGYPGKVVVEVQFQRGSSDQEYVDEAWLTLSVEVAPGARAGRVFDTFDELLTALDTGEVVHD